MRVLSPKIIKFVANFCRDTLYRLVNVSEGGYGTNLYYVNDSDQTLISVSTELGGFTTADDDVLTVQADKMPAYLQVQPGEGVKIQEFDGYYDLDFLLQSRIYIHCPKLGKLLLVS